MQRYGEHGSSPEREPLDGYHAPPSPAYPPETPYHDSVSPQPHYRQPPPPVPQHQHQDYGYEHEHEHDYDEGQAPAPPHHQGDAGYFAGEGHNDGEMAAGGMAGIAYGVAERNARESGMQAIHGGLPPPPSHARYPDGGYGNGNGNSYGNGYGYGPGNGGYYHPGSERGSMGVSGVSGANSSRSPSRSARESRSARDPYADDHYPQMYAAGSRNSNPMLGIVNPNEIVDDGDDGLDYSRRSQRNSTLGADAAKGAAAVTTAAVGAGAIRSALGRSAKAAEGKGNGAGADAGGIFDNGSTEEKSAWMAQHSSQSKKWRWIISIIVVLLIIGGVVGGVVGSRVANKSGSKSGNGSGSSKGGSGSGSGSGDDDGSDLTINSQEIKDLLNNPDLHKVFPGIDYTPLNTQYPDCLANPPSQNNITRDVAVLSQLTNKIRLYGTDCNQTQMVLHSISALEMTSDIKVWMGVWQDNNATTNARQLAQMWDILDKYGDDPFEGIIVANEVLFRKQFTVASLGELLDDVRTNLTKNKYDLPVATSDLGDDWTQALADDSDYIMANVHPFFSGTTATEAADWTYSFWKGHDGPFWKTDTSKNIISETGWPTGGGKDCGGPSTCTNPAVAGIDELNTFMSDWVCQALENGTNYFWFEAFDEPWKVIYNTPTEAWEDKWGLMDANRKLKDGVKIPDCGGKTVS